MEIENKEEVLNNFNQTDDNIRKIMTQEDKKQFKKNLIKFGIGVLLLLMSWSYIQKHPAEKVSVFSGFEVIFQKTEIFVQNLFGEHGDTLERKYSMEKYYKELIKMAENNKCIDIDKIKEIQDNYRNLKNEKKDKLDSVLPEYTKKAYEYDNIVKNNDC